MRAYMTTILTLLLLVTSGLIFGEERAAATGWFKPRWTLQITTM